MCHSKDVTKFIYLVEVHVLPATYDLSVCVNASVPHVCLDEISAIQSIQKQIQTLYNVNFAYRLMICRSLRRKKISRDLDLSQLFMPLCKILQCEYDSRFILYNFE